MPAPWKWCEDAVEVFVDVIGYRRSLLLVRKLREIPATNSSLAVTLERLQQILEGKH